MKRGIASMVLVGVLSTRLFAQAEPTSRTKPSEIAPLAGPHVEEKPKTTLVERESDGSVRRTEIPPEIAAARLLDLPAEVLAKVEDLMIERGRFFEKLIEENLDLLTKLDTAGNTGNKLDQAVLGLEALAKLAPLTREGSLRKRVRALLPADAVDRFDATLKEYWDAIVAQERARDARKSRFEIVAGERFQSMGREIAAAFQRLERSGTLLYQYFFSKVELSAEQEGAIRALIAEFVEETRGAPTKEQERRIFFAVMSKLDVKQQTALIKEFKARERPPKPAKTPSKRKAEKPSRER